MSVALLFPGQGAQQPHMLEAVPATPAAREVVAESRELLHNVDLDGNDTVATQLGLVTAGVACGRALIDDGGVDVAFVAGHSVGAFSAAVVSGVLSLPDALHTVHQRALSMAEVCRDGDWGMAAVLGLTPAAASRLATEGLWVANINSATQTVFAGTEAALRNLEDRARHAGARAVERLDVRIASHGPLQEPTAETITKSLDSVTVSAPSARYISNVGGRSLGTAAAVCDDLARSVARPVRWYDGVRLMAELGVTCTVEAVPGHTLSRLVAGTAPAITTLALGEDGFSSSVARARRSGTNRSL